MEPKRSLDGQWRYRPETMSLVFEEHGRPPNNPIYEVDLDRLTTSAELLDWILQIDAHGYQVSGFIHLLDRLCGEYLGQGIQGAFSPFGENRRVDWDKLKSTRFDQAGNV